MRRMYTELKNAMSFDELPAEIQAEIKDTLKAFDKCTVWFEYGAYHVELGCCLKSQYGADLKYIGEYTKYEIFTDAERIINYVESFHDYPIEYKGDRDYIGFIETLVWGDKVKFDENGNLVKA